MGTDLKDESAHRLTRRLAEIGSDEEIASELLFYHDAKLAQKAFQQLGEEKKTAVGKAVIEARARASVILRPVNL